MSWVYGDYITIDSPRERLARLRLHIQEVSNAISSPDLSGDGKSVQYGTLQTYLESLKTEERSLAVTAGGGLINGGASLSRNRRPRSR